MAATEPSAAAGPDAATNGSHLAPGDEPSSADLSTPRAPRVPTRVLVAVVLVLAVLLVVSLVVGFVILHQPRLTPVPVPSVSSIA